MSDAHGVARDQLRAFVERIERLEEEKKTIADDIKDVYGEAKAMGFDTVILKRVVALRKKDAQERMEQEMILSTYLIALGMLDEGSMPDDEPPAPKASRKPAMALQSPRMAAEAVSERTAFTGATVAPVLVEADKAEAVAGGLGQPEAIPALTGQFPGVNVGGPERAGVTVVGTESGTVASPKVLDGRSPVAGESRHHCDVSEDEAGQTLTGNPIPDIAPASQGEAEAPTGSTSGKTDGGDHEVALPDSHAAKAGPHSFSESRPAYILRPNCQHPDLCRSGTIDHCHGCKSAMREREAV